MVDMCIDVFWWVVFMVFFVSLLENLEIFEVGCEFCGSYW